MTSTGPEPAPSTALAEPPRHPRRIVYLGTPEMAVAPLRALVEAGYEVVLVITGAFRSKKIPAVLVITVPCGAPGMGAMR